ncbi:hypothetical protein [Amycolatopsis decaplanina]|uniref:Amino acid ABC transporter substrate-binding protein n=1 Tax=Amycolatopsis decaplanina DSM 44594 TaxID=1284240 RepID=M2YV60_9PSEU|nr:hypothetical protein [Amycolatopsis decaplanina]EME58812.1 amino acid ABC transporter substrate-binding protein [Amycolatopsis decaplanina DSM 44594]
MTLSTFGMSGVSVVELKGGAGKDLTPVLVTGLGEAAIETDDSAANDAPPPNGIPAGKAGN